MIRNSNIENGYGNGNGNGNVGGANKSILSYLNIKVLIYIFAFIIFIMIAYYFYKSYVVPTFTPSYANNNELVGSGSGSGSSNSKTAELLFFYVDWCPHCKTAKPAWEEVRAEYKNQTINGYKVIFTELNCTEETADVEKMMNQYQIEGYPTIKLLKDGQVIEFDAKPSKATLEQFLNTVL